MTKYRIYFGWYNKYGYDTQLASYDVEFESEDEAEEFGWRMAEDSYDKRNMPHQIDIEEDIDD